MNKHPDNATQRSRIVGIVLVVSLLCRIVFILVTDPVFGINNGGDAQFYLQVGRDLAAGYDYSQIPIPVAPLYLLVLGLPQRVLSVDQTILLVQIGQALMMTGATYIAYRLAFALTQNRRMALVTLIGLATSIAFLTESAVLLTETFYICFVLAGMWVYVGGFMSEAHPPLRRGLMLALSGIFFGLAALTRPVVLLFPVGIAIHMILLKRQRLIPVLLAAYLFMALSWTAYTSLHYEWTVVGSNQFIPAVWRGAVEGDTSPQINDQILGEDTYIEQTNDIIRANPVSYISLRSRELAGSYWQPHGTVIWGDSVSIRALAVAWMQDGYSAQGLWRLVTAEAFLVKLLIYIWHYIALIGGIVGMWLTRDRWQISLVFIGFIAYTTLLHFVSLAIPRYLFPTYPFFWIFAGVTLVTLWDTLTRNRAT